MFLCRADLGLTSEHSLCWLLRIAHELRNEVVKELSLGLVGESGTEREATLMRGGENGGILLLEASTLYRSGREAGEELRLHHRP